MVEMAIGRPPMSDSEKRTLPVEMRLNEEEKQKLLLAAKMAGMPLASWMRSNLLAVANSEGIKCKDCSHSRLNGFDRCMDCQVRFEIGQINRAHG